MKQYLQAFVLYQQDDSIKSWSLAKFRGNNLVFELTALSLFFTSFGVHPRLSIGPDIIIAALTAIS